MTNAQRLTLIGNNAYTVVALVRGDEVIGQWDAGDPEVWAAYLHDRPAAVAGWEATWPEHTRIEDYGKELACFSCGEPWQGRRSLPQVRCWCRPTR